MRSKGLTILIAFLISCSGSNRSGFDHDDGLAAFSEAHFVEDIKALSSDAFMGRMPFTEGETRTLDYLQRQFKAIGLEPGNGDSYLQPVPLVSITTQAAPTMKVTGGKSPITLKGREDYAIWTNRTEDSVALHGDELVFAGYGVEAPEYNWDDFGDVDVKDKIILVFVNDPGFQSGKDLFKGDTMTYYGRWTYKFEEAARKGAKGCLVIHDEVPASYGFQVVQNNWNTTRLQAATEGYQCAVVGWVSNGTARKLFEAAGMNYDTLFKAAHNPTFKAQPMHLGLTTAMRVTTREDTSYNVIGTIPGSTRSGEYIIYSAHWDHLGIGEPVDGDSIYNGALDNASGVAGIMEIARAFKSMKSSPERSLVFLAVTAEEQGLLGAEYYASHPIYPAASTVADINIDGINPYGPMKDIILIGKDQSELEDYLKEATQAEGRYVGYETHPEAGYFFRSDHFCFAKVGIPALYTETGIDLVEKGKEEGQRLADEYTEKYYHQPADEFDSTRWNTAGAVDDLQLLFQVGKRLSFDVKWPQWKGGSEFRAVRESYMRP